MAIEPHKSSMAFCFRQEGQTMKEEMEVVMAFRVPGNLRRKLDRLARETHRTRSGVLRELLRQASAVQPDLTLSQKEDCET
jgi:metal-responsive CopG/Arc/MetJ family transcriptional regulator